ncbi:MAG: DUF3846 domain-containing protein [Planctomycetota bacterium]|nr:DUF3846 domain-containing protein [Planctomycetota bacterium]
MAHVLFIPASGLVDIRDGKFEDFQSWVGGYVQCLPFTDTTEAYVNEDGIALGLPRNELATKLCFDYRIGLAPGDYIKGAMVIVGCKDESGEFDEVGAGFDILQPLLHELLEKAAILARTGPQATERKRTMYRQTPI